MLSAFAAHFRKRYAVLRFLPGIALEMSAGILSSQLAAKDCSTAVSREKAITAGQLSQPVLKSGIDNPPVQDADRFRTTRDFIAMRRIGVMQEFTRTDERRSRAAMKSTCTCRLATGGRYGPAIGATKFSIFTQNGDTVQAHATMRRDSQ